MIHLARVADAGEWTGQGAGPMSTRTGAQLVARRVLHRRIVKPGVFGGTSTGFEPAGETEGYVCAGCGYFEEYLKSPGEIAWDAIEGATWHSPKTRGGAPFR